MAPDQAAARQPGEGTPPPPPPPEPEQLPEQPPRGFPFAGGGGPEAAAMRAFRAALDVDARALEPTTDFWSAGGDSLAAAAVLPSRPRKTLLIRS